MKTFYRLVSIAVFCAAMTAISCGEATTDVNDDGGSIIPSNPSKPEEPDNTKVRKISKITQINDNYTRSWTLDYDANERVSKIDCVEGESGDYSKWGYNIRYYDDELNIFYSDEYDSGYVFISLNKSGYIASYAEEWEDDGYAGSYEQTFEYNLQGYLQEFEDVYYEIDESGEYTSGWGVTYKWSSGNIASRERYDTEDGEEDYSERWTMTYNNKKQDVINLDINAFVEYYSYDIGLEYFDGSCALALGLVGKTNKNLITKSVGECSDGAIYEITYKWSYDEDGYPIQCTAEGWYTYDSVQEDIAYSYEFEYVD